MHMMLDALWRALADCLRWRVIAWSLLPLLLIALMGAAVGVFWWESAVQLVQNWLEGSAALQWLWRAMGTAAGAASAVMAAVLVVAVISPVLIMLALAVVSVVMMPQMVRLVAQQRFPQLQYLHGAGLWSSVLWAVGATALALLALVLSMPLWLIPPFIVVLPPLIWGWLTYRMMAFDALAEHASAAERRAILHTHRYRLLVMGVACGYLGALPSIAWASGVVFVAAFWVLIPAAVWMYGWMLALSSLWFAHYGLAALEDLRQRAQAEAAPRV